MGVRSLTLTLFGMMMFLLLLVSFSTVKIIILAHLASQHFEKPGKKKPAETAMYTLLKEVLKMALKMLIDTVRGSSISKGNETNII